MSHDVNAYYDRIIFPNSIMLYKSRNKGEQHLHYKLEKWKKMCTFGSLNNISEHVTLVQLMYLLVNVNHAVSVVGNYIVDSNNEKSLSLTIESVIFFSCSDEDQYFAIFKEVFYAVSYFNKKSNTKCV